MNVKELNRAQLLQLKANYYEEHHAEGVSYGELADVDSLVSDEEIIEAYDGVDFVEEDFTNSEPITEDDLRAKLWEMGLDLLKSGNSGAVYALYSPQEDKTYTKHPNGDGEDWTLEEVAALFENDNQNPEDLNFIKVMIPPDEEAYKHGAGEGCFFIVDDRTKTAYDLNATGGGFFGILDNNSLYYKGLKHGERLPLEMRGDRAPVVPIEALSKWEVRTPEEVKKLYEKHLARELMEDDFPDAD